MIKTLQIKDYALISNIEVEFGKGLNIITGETGAGKSILIDAMGLLLGERASTEVVRKGASKSIVEGIFNVKENKKVYQLLDDNDLDKNDELIIRREISLKGSNRCFVNDTPVTLSLIKEIGDLLVDMHGQHEHQSLLRTETHVEMIDEFGDLGKLYADYSKGIKEFSEVLKELKLLKEKEKSLREKKDFYEFQIKEIDAVSPEPGEEEKLEEELNILENAEKLMELSSEIFNNLYDSEDSVYDRFVDVKNKLEELGEIDKSFVEKIEEAESALAQLNDISDFVRSYRDNIELEPAKLEEIRERLSSLTMLKKKYGGSVEAILKHREEIGKEFDLAENYSDRIKELQSKLNSFRKNAGNAAFKLSEERKKLAKKIKNEIEKTFQYLGIEDSNFAVKFSPKSVQENSEHYILVNGKKFGFDSTGFEDVEFFISTNLGEDPKPLNKVASGGEISRIMLAMKSILAKSDKLPLLIFDEIDTGVSGRIAQKVGNSLKTLADYHQIISITHLPQIAGLADYHYVVEKKQAENRVVSSIKKLSNEERVTEVAKLMSGENITDASLKGAKELMGISG